MYVWVGEKKLKSDKGFDWGERIVLELMSLKWRFDALLMILRG